MGGKRFNTSWLKPFCSVTRLNPRLKSGVIIALRILALAMTFYYPFKICFIRKISVLSIKSFPTFAAVTKTFTNQRWIVGRVHKHI